jgi:hypothetical protein
MTIYHGTDEESAAKIEAEKILKGDGRQFGPGICLTLERALNYSAIKCAKYGIHARTKGRIVVIENIPSQILNSASKDAPEGFTLNDEFGKPSKGLHLQRVKIISIKEAQLLSSIGENEFKDK